MGIAAATAAMLPCLRNNPFYSGGRNRCPCECCSTIINYHEDDRGSSGEEAHGVPYASAGVAWDELIAVLRAHEQEVQASGAALCETVVAPCKQAVRRSADKRAGRAVRGAETARASQSDPGGAPRI